jgi:hypothetical protein
VVQVDGDGYVCFMVHNFDTEEEMAFRFAESESGRPNLHELATRHTLV